MALQARDLASLQQQHSELTIKYGDLTAHLHRLEQQSALEPDLQPSQHQQPPLQHEPTLPHSYTLSYGQTSQRQQPPVQQQQPSFQHQPTLPHPYTSSYGQTSQRPPIARQQPSLQQQPPSHLSYDFTRPPYDIDDNCSELTVNLLQPLDTLPLTLGGSMRPLTSSGRGSYNDSRRQHSTAGHNTAGRGTDVSQHVRDLLGLGEDQVSELMSSLYDA